MRGQTASRSRVSLPPACPAALRSRQRAVRAVAVGFVPGTFAAAPGDLFRLGEFHPDRPQAGARVRAIAEGLARRAAATAPRISAGEDGFDERRLLADDRLSHFHRHRSRLGCGRSFHRGWSFLAFEEQLDVVRV